MLCWRNFEKTNPLFIFVKVYSVHTCDKCDAKYRLYHRAGK